MKLIDQVKAVCDRLSQAGWRDLFLLHGIEIRQATAEDLARELDKEVTVARSIPGFSDFVSETARGIEPAQPSASLLYHAFASPNVSVVPSPETTLLGTLDHAISAFPTLKELDTIENYIFASADRSVQDIKQFAAHLFEVDLDAIELSAAVYATEYRPAAETPHRRHADLCFARTGVARVGTASAVYDGALRGYVPFREGDDSPNAIRVLPCRYVTYLAVRSRHQPRRFAVSEADGAGDRTFWVPVHKLFEGDECLAGTTLDIKLLANHENRKLERLHSRLEAEGFPSGFSAEQRQKTPFVKRHGFASWSETYQGAGGLLTPQPQPLASIAEFEERPLSFDSPTMGTSSFSDAFSPTLSLGAPAVPVRPWPEYAHIRFREDAGNVVYWGDEPDLTTTANQGGFRALNVLDSTADGWVEARVSGIAGLASIPAYSLISAPDFFPSVEQREVFEWWKQTQAKHQAGELPGWWAQLLDRGYWEFWRAEPRPMSEVAFAPNVKLSGAGFSESDTTVSALVTLLQELDLSLPELTTPSTRRHATLPDSAAGVFAPGWDTSADLSGAQGSQLHFSGYGLGSPFPEDAKLCAALSTFWPAAAPDTQRTFFRVRFARGSVCPLTDVENGAASQSLGWDGLRGPQRITEDGSKTLVRYPSYEYADYTQNTLEGKLSMAETSRVDFQEYTARILATLRMYRTLESLGDKNSLHILSFIQALPQDQLLREAQHATTTSLVGPVYKFEVFHDSAASSLDSDSLQDELYSIDRIFTIFVGADRFVLARVRQGDGTTLRTPWQSLDL